MIPDVGALKRLKGSEFVFRRGVIERRGKSREAKELFGERGESQGAKQLAQKERNKTVKRKSENNH